MNELETIVGVVMPEAARRGFDAAQTFALMSCVMAVIVERGEDDDAMHDLADTCGRQADDVMDRITEAEMASLVDDAVAAAKACTP